MLRIRVIPVLLLRSQSLVKTVRFGKFTYVGDPANTVRIFNELEVDELLFLDITVSREGRTPNLKVLSDISDECFMPLGYGGGISTLDQAKAIFDIGFEKIALNTQAVNNPALVSEIAKHYGSQAVIVSIDTKSGLLNNNQTVRTLGGRRNSNLSPIEWAKEVEQLGAGEILLTSINKEGSWQGFDLDLVKSVANSVSIPVIAHGGAGTVEHINQVINKANASAVALGSMVVYQKKDMGVLVNFSSRLQVVRNKK